ncbi:MAG: S8 family serine peptidase [Saprospiraceae bacterium]
MYKVKFGGKNGKTINLVESPNMVAIRTRDNQELDEVVVSRKSRELIRESTEVANFPEAGVTVRRVGSEGAPSNTALRDETRAALKQEDNIRFAGRVLQDAESGEVMLYTENFFIKFKDTVPEAECLAVIENYKLKIKSKLAFANNAWFIEANEGTGLQVFEIAERLLKEKSVEYCHPELVQERRFKSINPLQWHLAKTTIDGTPVDANVNIEKAWQITRGQGVTIAVIDDGIDVDHPEFAGRIRDPFDATENSDNPRPKTKEDNHGTACAGMACAAGLQGGASGTAPEATLLPIRLQSGLGSMAEANAFAWAADHGADVISCSWGPSDGEWWNPGDPVHNRRTVLPDSTRLSMLYALSKGRGGRGCVILFAAGNGNEDTKNDGYVSNPDVITVAACNDTGRRSVYSDFGDAVWVAFPSGDYGWKPFNHAAPITQGLHTTDRRGTEGYDAGDYLSIFGGTSGACPGMAGVVALMLAANPNLRPAEIKELLKISCVRIDEKEGDYDAKGHSAWYGYGRVDAGLAVKNARQASLSLLEGSVKLAGLGEQPLYQGGLEGPFAPAKKVLGLRLQVKAGTKSLKVKYKANVPGLGIVENPSEGAFVGTATSRQRIIGFAVELSGTAAKKYTVEYAARLTGAEATATAKDGAWCGTNRKTGKTIEAIAVVLRAR